MSDVFDSTVNASGEAYAWVRRWSDAHSAKLVVDDSTLDAFFELVESARGDGDLSLDEPGDYPSLPDPRPEGAEFILISGYRFWGFALVHGDASWMGCTTELEPNCVWAVTLKDLAALKEFAGLTACPVGE